MVDFDQDELAVVIAGLTRPVGATEVEVRQIVEGWRAYFEREKIVGHAQEHEFNEIMKARVAAGSISVLAPDMVSLR